MKKFLSMVCAVALAALCAVPAFAEATPGEAANTAAASITAENASTEKGASFAKSIADYYTANPTVPVTKQNANAAATVINAHADKAIANGSFDKDTIKKVYPSTGSVTNAVAVQTIEKSQISNLSLTKKDDNTLVLSATWTGTQPSAGANIAVYGMDTSAAYQIVFVDDAGNRTTIDSVSKVADGVVVFWVPHFSTYEIVKVSAAADTAPTVPVTKQNANAAATVINAHADKAIANGSFDKDTIKKVYPSTGSVTNAVAVQTIEKSQISNLSLTKKDDNTLVLSATWTGTQPSAGANIAVYGMDTSAAYQIVFVDDAGNRTTIDSVSKVADGVVVFWVPHFSTYEIVKVSAAADTAPATTAPATTTVDAAAVDAQFYTCKACGYHNWTGTVGGYKCDHCGHIEAKDLSSYPNVKGTATLPTATSAAASNNIIKATGADMSMVVLAVLALAAALVAGFACIVRKQGLGK